MQDHEQEHVLAFTRYAEEMSRQVDDPGRGPGKQGKASKGDLGHGKLICGFCGNPTDAYTSFLDAKIDLVGYCMACTRILLDIRVKVGLKP